VLVEHEWVLCLFLVCSIVGAVGAAYALLHFRREYLHLLAWCLGITFALDVVQWSVFIGSGLIEVSPVGPARRVAVGVLSLLQYMAVMFVIEEVTFRMLDSHLHDVDKQRGVLSAVFISAAWGLWHLPISEELTWEAVGILLYVHVPYGVCLSLFWRKTGNLVVPGLCHALGDAIRNALMFVS
jgi:membrane protease YdiL (CAAX protease family)